MQNAYDRFMAGYGKENVLDDVWRERLPSFLKYRQMLLFVVFSDEWQKPNKWQNSVFMAEVTAYSPAEGQ